jgi:hypothetical protein
MGTCRAVGRTRRSKNNTKQWTNRGVGPGSDGSLPHVTHQVVRPLVCQRYYATKYDIVCATLVIAFAKGDLHLDAITGYRCYTYDSFSFSSLRQLNHKPGTRASA